MPFSIDEVVPWGRRLDEYRAMFDLSECDLKRRILGCGDGPASLTPSCPHRAAAWSPWIRSTAFPQRP